MTYLNDNELMDVDGGGINVGAVIGIVAGITFIVGLIDGLFRPLKCN